MRHVPGHMLLSRRPELAPGRAVRPLLAAPDSGRTDIFEQVLRNEDVTNREMVPEAGLEPAQCCHRGILSPLRLPVSPLRLGTTAT